ncbi:FMN-dependent NADH-azoreductase [Metamycoplasma buccale]|uniref:FMN-dependent NADH-azoreductase n=1 Tax=Metamycoplasma buccale TaxID=55602 RepID=UPI00398EEEC9
MNKVLVLYTSPLPEEKSISTYIANKFLEEYKKTNPNDFIETLDLNNLSMANKSLNKDSFSSFWNEEDSDKFINQLKNINKLIISTAMINFNIPVTLKNYLDHICVANKTFSYKYSKKGDAIGLLTNVKVQIIATQGAPEDWYTWGLFTKYLEGTLNFLGMSVNKTILISGVKTSNYIQKTKEEIFEEFKNTIENQAKKF